MGCCVIARATMGLLYIIMLLHFLPLLLPMYYCWPSVPICELVNGVSCCFERWNVFRNQVPYRQKAFLQYVNMYEYVMRRVLRTFCGSMDIRSVRMYQMLHCLHWKQSCYWWCYQQHFLPGVDQTNVGLEVIVYLHSLQLLEDCKIELSHGHWRMGWA